MTRRRIGLLGLLGLLFAMVPSVEAAPVEERVIVVFKPEAGPAEAAAKGLAEAFGGQVGFVYQHALSGMTLTLPGDAVNGLPTIPRSLRSSQTSQ